MWNTKTQQAVSNFFPMLRTKFPNAHIYVTSPIWDARKFPPARISMMREAVRNAAQSNGVTYLDLGEIFKGKYTLIGRDWIHPNAQGYALMASEIVRQLRANGE